MNAENSTHTPPELDDGPLTSTAVSGRRFPAGTTVDAGLAVFSVACGDDDDTDTGTGQTDGTSPTTAAGANADLETAAVAAGLEKLAVDTYTAAGQFATTGKLGASVPPPWWSSSPRPAGSTRSTRTRGTGCSRAPAARP